MACHSAHESRTTTCFLHTCRASSAGEALFFKDFAAAFGKLLALGCPQCSVEPGLLGKLRGLVGL